MTPRVVANRGCIVPPTTSAPASPDNDDAARFSMELGVRAGVLVNTLPAIPIGRLEGALSQHDPAEDLAGIGPPTND